jgi:hypothetical protein
MEIPWLLAAPDIQTKNYGQTFFCFLFGLWKLPH